MSGRTHPTDPRPGDIRPCPVCGARGGAAPVRRGAAGPQGARPVACASCGVVYIDPVPAAAVAPAAYDTRYYEPWSGPAARRARARLWRRRLALLEARQARGTLLDVGCGDGGFLATARESGWGVEGIEFSPEGARRASARLGRPVAVGDLAGGRLLRGPFDAVTLWHVLEHLEDAAAMLRAARDRLRPGGLLAVAVPNLDNLPFRCAYFLARGRRPPLYEAGAREPHLTHFKPATLRAALERHGFEVLEIRPDRCALTPVKRGIDAVAALLSRVRGRLMTDAIVAFARRPR